MGKPMSVAQKNKLLWWKDLLSHIGKGVDTERGEELGIKTALAWRSCQFSPEKEKKLKSLWS